MASGELEAKPPSQGVGAATVYSLPTCWLPERACATLSAAQTWGLRRDKQELGAWDLFLKALLGPRTGPGGLSSGLGLPTLTIVPSVPRALFP